MQRFTFNLEAHSRTGSFVEPSFEIWIEIGRSDLGYTKQWMGRDAIVSKVFTVPWAEDDRDRSVARLLARVVENVCYPTSLGKVGKTALFDEIKAYVPSTVREVIGVGLEEIEDQIAEHKAREQAKWERMEKAWAEGPAPETGHSWEDRGRIGGHFY